jgi:signal transduction histidine kinase
MSEQDLDFSTLLAASVHDMKNSIGLLVHLIDEVREQTRGRSEDFGQLQLEALRLNSYLIQLMTLYKLENDQYAPQQDEHYLDEFIEDLVLMNRPVLEPRGIALEQQVEDSLSWYYDAQLVTGVLGNILTNVIRYDEGQVKALADHVRIGADEHQGFLRIRVEDDGPGYPEAMLGELEAVPMGVDFISGSTGFGLYFSSQVARLHRQGGRQGFVRLSNGSSLGGGCFELYLP